MNTLTIILIALTATLLIANIVMFAIERKTKSVTPIYKARTILDDDLESLLNEVILFINAVNVVSARYHESDDIYVVTIIYTED
ncbi:hypothetical protein CIRMBP1266_00789 [Enterococcus cecorum]|nr:hypothetical protein CIRMBP1266_00789 [Enterococcus cecorum]